MPPAALSADRLAAGQRDGVAAPAAARVAVTGATGYLGARVVAALEAVGALALPLGRAEGVDLARPQTVLAAVAAAQPDAIVHTAAANPGRPAASFEPVNRLGSAAVALAAAQHGARLVHVSTDVVFDGRAAPYADGAVPSPTSAYGRSKAGAEAAVAAACPSAAIVRTSLIYGLHEPDRSTAGFIERLGSGAELRLFTDVVRQPVWVEALAEGLVRLAFELRDVAGTLNVAGRQPLDRATFGRAMLRYWGVATDAVVDVQAADLLARQAPGEDDIPLDLRLELERATALGLDCPGVDEVLARRG